MSERVPIPVTQIIAALERESGNTDTDPRWIAASALRKMEAWERRTLMCEISDKPSETWGSAAPEPIDASSQPESASSARKEPRRCSHGVIIPHRCRDCEQEMPPASEICEHYNRRSTCLLCSTATSGAKP